MIITIDTAKCNGCNICAKICPQKILKITAKKAAVMDQERCMGCFGCEDECSTGAIRLQRFRKEVLPLGISGTTDNKCDVAIIGGGPSGLGAAIACARNGLKVSLFEKLPNNSISHHPDGGVLMTLPGMSSVKGDGKKLEFPEIGISIELNSIKKCRYVGLLGPDGLSTQNDFRKDVMGYIVSKDDFVRSLADEAGRSGAMLNYNTKVVDLVKDNDSVTGILLDSGAKITSKVVVCADGVFAKMSKKAGMQICEKDNWHASILTYEYKNSKNLEPGLFYLYGDLETDESVPSTFGAIGVTDVIHVLIGFLYQKKQYPAPKPMDFYLQKMLSSDRRIKNLVSDSLNGQKPDFINGCRAVLRQNCNIDTAKNGIISIGDTWVNSGEIGNIPALTNGVYAAEVIVDAIKNGDYSKNSLKKSNHFITKRVLALLKKNKEMKLMDTTFDKEGLKVAFEFFQHMNYPTLLFGTPSHQGRMFANFIFKNIFRFIRHPTVGKSMF